MIILQVGSTTDWIQAVAAIIASIGAVVGYILLIKDGKEKQSQINVLTDLAKEAKEQTNHLASQVDQMNEGNKLQTEYVRLFQRNVEINDKKRKNEIKPYFVFNAMEHRDYGVNMILVLLGQPAKLIGSESIEDDNIIPSLSDNYLDNKVIKGNIVNLKIQDKTRAVNFDDYKLLKIKIVFEDTDSNKYFQIIEGTYSGGIEIHEPIEIPVQI
jgi:uncharacterized protein YfcZ (UPF0381/DUF406 family)